MSLVMRKSAFCIYENKDAAQLRGNHEADQRLCSRYTDSTIPLLPKSEIYFKPLAFFCSCTVRFVWDLVGNPEDRFSHNEAQMRVRIVLGRLPWCWWHMSLVVRKPVFGVSDQIQTGLYKHTRRLET